MTTSQRLKVTELHVLNHCADPEQSVQLHNLQGDVVGEQRLCLKNKFMKTKKDQS